MAKKSDPAEFVDIELSRPLTIDGSTVTKLRMREPTLGDQLANEKMKGDAAEKEVAMMANLCEVTPDDLAKLSLRDYRKVQTAFVGFTV